MQCKTFLYTLSNKKISEVTDQILFYILKDLLIGNLFSFTHEKHTELLCAQSLYCVKSVTEYT